MARDSTFRPPIGTAAAMHYDSGTVSMSRWRIAYHLLTAVFVLTAALNLLHVRAGVLTNYAADLVVPAWMYVVVRGRSGHRQWLASSLGRTPEIAAIILFVASAGSELSQKFWPRGPFPGRYDPLDLVAYALGLTVCYVADRATLRRAAPDQSIMECREA